MALENDLQFVAILQFNNNNNNNKGSEASYLQYILDFPQHVIQAIKAHPECAFVVLAGAVVVGCVAYPVEAGAICYWVFNKGAAMGKYLKLIGSQNSIVKYTTIFIKHIFKITDPILTLGKNLFKYLADFTKTPMGKFVANGLGLSCFHFSLQMKQFTDSKIDEINSPSFRAEWQARQMARILKIKKDRLSADEHEVRYNQASDNAEHHETNRFYYCVMSLGLPQNPVKLTWEVNGKTHFQCYERDFILRWRQDCGQHFLNPKTMTIMDVNDDTFQIDRDAQIYINGLIDALMPADADVGITHRRDPPAQDPLRRKEDYIVPTVVGLTGIFLASALGGLLLFSVALISVETMIVRPRLHARTEQNQVALDANDPAIDVNIMN